MDRGERAAVYQVSFLQGVHQVPGRSLLYFSFGVPATVLEMIPFVGIFFAFTNTVGAALWAADLEQEQRGAAPQSSADSGSSAMQKEL